MINIINPFQIVLKICSLVEGVAAYLQGKGYGTATIKNEVKFVSSLLGKEPKLAIDVGGNIGEYTAELRNQNPNCKIHTFEPSVTNIQKLNARFSDDKNISIIPYALANTSGPTTLFANRSGSGLGSLTKRKLDHFNIHFDFKEPVNTLRFEDYWIKYLNQQPIDIVKIDIEGRELDALKGFGRAIQATSVFQFEFGGCNIDTRTYFQDFWYFFHENKFEIYRITPLGLNHIRKYRESDEFFRTTNFIAVNRKNG
jgi:FkbM family methyltransferase